MPEPETLEQRIERLMIGVTKAAYDRSEDVHAGTITEPTQRVLKARRILAVELAPELRRLTDWAMGTGPDVMKDVAGRADQAMRNLVDALLGEA